MIQENYYGVTWPCLYFYPARQKDCVKLKLHVKCDFREVCLAGYRTLSPGLCIVFCRQELTHTCHKATFTCSVFCCLWRSPMLAIRKQNTILILVHAVTLQSRKCGNCWSWVRLLPESKFAVYAFALITDFIHSRTKRLIQTHWNLFLFYKV